MSAANLCKKTYRPMNFRSSQEMRGQRTQAGRGTRSLSRVGRDFLWCFGCFASWRLSSQKIWKHDFDRAYMK